eukprot:TRINITY_DN879_c0_g3_i2.p3 TRINITY_DN879_c0_g3~~TRINITY_DN879_c0_g3_i2.p3  ORF type:complete len:105 (-),score=32.59 TRINITY_DN879_c0_g3_i2:275-589(-)
MFVEIARAAPTLPIKSKFVGAVAPKVLRTHDLFCGQTRLARRNMRGNKKTALQAVSSQEVAQLAGEAGMIAGTAAVMFAVTLIGLTLGFVLLRVEALVEEEKIP